MELIARDREALSSDKRNQASSPTTRISPLRKRPLSYCFHRGLPRYLIQNDGEVLRRSGFSESVDFHAVFRFYGGLAYLRLPMPCRSVTAIERPACRLFTLNAGSVHTSETETSARQARPKPSTPVRTAYSLTCLALK